MLYVSVVVLYLSVDGRTLRLPFEGWGSVEGVWEIVGGEELRKALLGKSDCVVRSSLSEEF